MQARTLPGRALAFVALLAAIAPFVSTASASAAVLPLKATAASRTFDAPTSLISAGSVVETGYVTAWVAGIAGQVDRAPVNASTKLDAKHRKLIFKTSRVGFRLNQAGSVSVLCAALASVTETSAPVTVSLVGSRLNPSVAKLGKHIMVVKSRRKIYLYNETRLEKTYRCAIGQSRWPTPSGTFRIGKKVKNPSWTNGYASWSRNMPSYIGPSPNNPLGTRAMYVYGKHGDTGVRFHGVPHSEDSSIGHAASHGCLRMHRRDVENFYPRVKVGTPVYIIK